MEDLKEKLNRLDLELGKIIALVIPEEKLQTASDLITKYTKEFYDRIYKLEGNNADEVTKAFNPWVNNIMSSIEALGVSKNQFKSVRRLILNELYRFKNAIIGGDNNINA